MTGLAVQPSNQELQQLRIIPTCMKVAKGLRKHIQSYVYLEIYVGYSSKRKKLKLVSRFQRLNFNICAKVELAQNGISTTIETGLIQDDWVYMQMQRISYTQHCSVKHTLQCTFDIAIKRFMEITLLSFEARLIEAGLR